MKNEQEIERAFEAEKARCDQNAQRLFGISVTELLKIVKRQEETIKQLRKFV